MLTMTDLTNATKTIDGKLRFLEFISEETDEIIQKNERKSVERQIKIYEAKFDEIEDLKLHIQELRLQAEEDPSEVKKWRLTINEKQKMLEPSYQRLQKVMQTFQDEEANIKEQERKQECEKEMAMEKMKLQQRLRMERQSLESRSQSKSDMPGKSVMIKLPKLEITKFKGTHVDWFRFWNQFKTEVDQQNIEQITKFNYLKEFIEPKVRSLIDNINHDAEGYERAKQILKSKYGKDSEIVNAHVQIIFNLPHVRGTSPSKIHQFYQRLLPSVQALESMGKLKEISGYTRATLDKLEGIRADLVRLDDDWQQWGFPHLVAALSKWTERNPVPESVKDRVFATNTAFLHKRSCVYCNSEDHKSIECTKVKAKGERRDILRSKRLCFNCTRAGHRASDCTSKGTCKNCKAKHHTSICEKERNQEHRELLMSTVEQGVIYPVVVVKVNGITCRALLDTGSGSSYISTKLADLMNKKPVRVEHRKIDTMISTTTRKVEVFQVNLQSLNEYFSIEIEAGRVDRGELLTTSNPKYQEIIHKYSHLHGVEMLDKGEKNELPVHMILGASTYSRIKTPTKPRIGKPGDPIAELTKLGWVIMSPGHEADLSNMFFAKSSSADLERLCSLDILGLKGEEYTEPVHTEFRDQLERSGEGWYQTGLIWKPNIPDLPDNEKGSRARLHKLIQRLERQPDLYDKYEEILTDQINQGIIEKVAESHHSPREFYLPHRAVVRDSAESTKVRIVFDASARANDTSPSLNDCLETGPPLQNQIWEVLTRNRMQPITLTGDLKQAFLQIRIREQDRDVLRFHWPRDRNLEMIEIYRFTRVLFGLNQSPFILGATIKAHLNGCEAEFPNEVAEIKQSLYVDDVILGAESVKKVEHLKTTAISIFNQAKFTLHKWHSNRPTLETESNIEEATDQSFAKEQLGTKDKEIKLLGLMRDTLEDTVSIQLEKNNKQFTKRGVLKQLAAIYDPLGLVSAVTLIGKIIFRDICNEHLQWDEELPEKLKQRWVKWIQSLPEKVVITRSIPKADLEISSVDLHAFGDASQDGVAALVYVVVWQESNNSQGLITAKSRLAKKGLTIPRLELVAGHMAANLIDNAKKALQGYPIRYVYAWLDSSVALHWIKGENQYKQL